jgi:hypothetical protein
MEPVSYWSQLAALCFAWLSPVAASEASCIRRQNKIGDLYGQRYSSTGTPPGFLGASAIAVPYRFDRFLPKSFSTTILRNTQSYSPVDSGSRAIAVAADPGDTLAASTQRLD